MGKRKKKKVSVRVGTPSVTGFTTRPVRVTTAKRKETTMAKRTKATKPTFGRIGRRKIIGSKLSEEERKRRAAARARAKSAKGLAKLASQRRRRKKKR
jgi:hypothetical protein